MIDVITSYSIHYTKLYEEIEAAMRRKPVNLAGRTTVRELMSLLASCAFLVTNDSGPMHIGAALGVPVTAIFGPTDWKKTAPWTRKARVVRVDVDCSPCHLRECNRGHECMLGVITSYSIHYTKLYDSTAPMKVMCWIIMTGMATERG